MGGEEILRRVLTSRSRAGVGHGLGEIREMSALMLTLRTGLIAALASRSLLDNSRQVTALDHPGFKRHRRKEEIDY